MDYLKIILTEGLYFKIQSKIPQKSELLIIYHKNDGVDYSPGQKVDISTVGLGAQEAQWEKYPPAKVGGQGFDPRVEKVPWRKKWQPAPVFLLG